ncbi:uncharacterized protein BO97DRAFT_414337 [Aspergillus homomorphus CBS 101889]|uniref:Uncharacterized protein n=1 Tax=Aspergillus homomorphus (strain CBS 101889) TaxID=1450537 RepID=A0A395I0B2_ASPHC|nr:hypothetical protein BO97DRAFT_414337 [Aspergillus homomorphus CBS 101889]RAL12568.1 hypothetical protein BO97DRAFT_414337 [Aspergillus homomorphus CBS 101889]
MVPAVNSSSTHRKSKSRKDKWVPCASRPDLKWDEVEFPDPVPQYEALDLKTLEDPPENFKIGNTVRGRVTKWGKATRQDLQLLLRFHGWGFDHGVEIGTAHNPELLFAIWKIIYNYASGHRPQTWDDLFDLTRDAGPRLLAINIKRPCFPVSRYYPTIVTWQLGPNYQRPLTASPFLSDLCIHQMLLPSSGGALLGDPTNQADFQGAQMAIVNTSQSSVTNSTSYSYPSNTPHPTPQATPTPVAAQPQQLQQLQPELNTVSLPYESSTNGTVPAEGATSSPTTTANLAEVHAFPALNNAIRRAILTETYHELKPIKMERPLTRGRGPMWSENSGAIDALIVVAKLLKAGSTKIDQKDQTWRLILDEAELTYIQAANFDWGTCNPETAIQLKTQLQAELQKPDKGIGETLEDIRDAWFALTKAFAQFNFHSLNICTFCSCRNTEDYMDNWVDCAAVPIHACTDTNGVTVQDLVNRWFAKRRTESCLYCEKENAVTVEKFFRSIPLRLAVTPDFKACVCEHTRDICVSYTDTDGVDHRAYYKWIGGIYLSDGRVRVYWLDAERGERDNGKNRVYESRAGPEIMVEPIARVYPHDRVPADWWENKPIPMLFFERILLPSPEILQAAMQAVGDVAKATNASESQAVTAMTVAASPEDTEELQYGYGYDDYTNLENQSMTGVIEGAHVTEESGFEGLLNTSNLDVNWLSAPNQLDAEFAVAGKEPDQPNTDAIMHDIGGLGETGDLEMQESVEK